MKAAILNQTFRVNDNILLDGADCAFVIIERERLPTRDYNVFRKNLCWNFHQYNLLLQTLIYLQQELSSYIPLYLLYVDRKDIINIFRSINKQFNEISSDYLYDPVYYNFINNMKKVFKSKLSLESTFTLIDWRSPQASKFLQDYYKTAKPFSKLTKLKSFIIDNTNNLNESYPILNRSKYTIGDDLSRYMVDISTELRNHQEIMQTIGMTIHIFNNDLEYFKNCIKLIDDDTWYKPKTSVGLPWGYKVRGKNNLNTSQLSPYLSIGCLSSKFFWNNITTQNTDIGSAKDQLLWRECFNATAIATDLKLTKRTDDFWLDSNDSHFIDHKAKEYNWLADKQTIMDWQQGNIENAFDTNKAMNDLWKDGWIHHLQRHLVADVLTRGKLQQHWAEGIYWFRYTLLDHDSAVNRANWMWLSAVAFSSKQKVYHYNPEKYIRNNTFSTDLVSREEN